MYIQLAVLYLLAMNAGALTGNYDSCSSRPCARRAGIYRFTVTRANVVLNEVYAFHNDGSFSAISAGGAGDPTANPPVPGFTDFNAAWTCDGSNAIVANIYLFFFPTTVSPRSFGYFVHRIQFDQYGRATGRLNGTLYDIDSTQNPNPAKWKPLGTLAATSKAYKLLSFCDG